MTEAANRYPDFNNIAIANAVGVSPVGDDTTTMARLLAGLEFTHALDVGTGTGFIAIYLNSTGRKCSGSDINVHAIKCAQQNAELNEMEIDFLQADVCSGIPGKYDLIFFNPPHGNTRSKFLSKILEVVKSMLPKESTLLLRATYPFVKRQRYKIVHDFLEGAKSVLLPNGKIAFYLYEHELKIVDGIEHRILGGTGQLKLVALEDPFSVRFSGTNSTGPV